MCGLCDTTWQESAVYQLLAGHVVHAVPACQAAHNHLIRSQSVETQHNVCRNARAARRRKFLDYSPVRKDMCLNTVAILEYERLKFLRLEGA